MKFVLGIISDVKNLLLISVVTIILSIVAFGVHYKDKYDKASKDLGVAVKSLSSAKKELESQKHINQQLSDLDTIHTRKLNDAISDNNNLRNRLAHGGRVYVRGKCPANPKGGNATSSSMGNDTTIELSGVSGQNIPDIREGIIKDREKILYLQGYAKTCASK